MPTQHETQKTVMVKITAAETSALLIEAMAARHGVTVNQAHFRFVDSNGEQTASPLLTMNDQLLILNVTPADVDLVDDDFDYY